MSPAKKAAMLKAFDAFSSRIADRYKDAAQALLEDRYEEAHQILAELSKSHAKTSLSLRNVLVREGLMKEEQ